jgi:hypothetical protein
MTAHARWGDRRASGYDWADVVARHGLRWGRAMAAAGLVSRRRLR